MPVLSSGSQLDGSHTHGVKESTTELKEDSGNSRQRQDLGQAF